MLAKGLQGISGSEILFLSSSLTGACWAIWNLRPQSMHLYGWRTQWCTWAFRETVTSHLTHTNLFCATAVCSKSCPIFCEPMDCSLPVSSVHGIFQARILEWVSISFSRGSIFPTQGSNPPLLVLLHWQADSLPLAHLGSHICNCHRYIMFLEIVQP